jgi:hypothetical protein
LQGRDKTWKTAQKGKSVSIDSSCTSSQYLFLATSTSDADTTTAFPVTIKFTVKKVPKKRKAKRDKADGNPMLGENPGDNSSVIPAEDTPEGDPDNKNEIRKRQDGDGDSCPTSSCPYGSWILTAALDADGIKDSTPEGITVSNIDVTGSATFTLDQETKRSTLQFDSFSASFDDTSVSPEGEDVSIHYDLAIDGGGTATAIFADDGQSFTLAKPTYTGSFASQTTYPEGAPQGATGDFGVGFGPDVDVVFACDSISTDGDNHMSLNGLFGGAFIYDLFFEPADTTA